jgi:hypothetical protein
MHQPKIKITENPLQSRIQWLKFALSKGTNRVGAPLPSPEDGNIQFPKQCIF